MPPSAIRAGLSPSSAHTGHANCSSVLEVSRGVGHHAHSDDWALLPVGQWGGVWTGTEGTHCPLSGLSS